MVLSVALLACQREEPHGEPPAPASGPAGPASAAASAGSKPSLASAVPAVAGPEVRSGPCPADMRHVSGSYCLAAVHTCLRWQEVREGGVTRKNQCAEYRKPSGCFEDRRRPLSFCMDTYEWPNEKGALPRVLVSWEEARDLCAGAGKRLCTADEMTFACEEEDQRPHVYGWVRDDTKCNIDRPYRPRTFDFAKYDACMADPDCKAAFEAIDQRLPAGSMPGCTNRFGVYDLNGNANEWVIRPEHKSPNRSGIKGGWWGPVRNRCRPIVDFHDEGDWGYEVGFRCCKDAS